MSPFFEGILSGMFVGVFIGIFVIALLQAAKKDWFGESNKEPKRLTESWMR